jgi:hypothetical protein
METDKNKSVFDDAPIEGGASLKKFSNDQVIVLQNVKEIRTQEFTYKDNSKKKKKVYLMSDGTEYVVPLTLHNKLVACRKEYGQKITSCKVRISGSGLETRYDVLPVI